MKKYLKHKVFNILSEIVSENNTSAFVIGGFVRDIILRRPLTDIDIVVLGSGIDLAKKLSKRTGSQSKVNIFKNFGTAMLRFDNIDIEFVGARKESYSRNSRKPVVENGSLEDDQKRRDFTINALALSLNSSDYGKLIDPFNGINDIKNKIIRTPLDPVITFSDDPLRMIRAIRFASQLDFNIEPKTLQAIIDKKDRIKIVSVERIVEELNKIILSKIPSKGLILLEETGLLGIVFPELANLKGVEDKYGKMHKDNFLHSVQVLDNISKNTNTLWLRWAALLHDIAKPNSKKYYPDQGWTFHGHEYYGAKMIPSIFRRLKLPLNEKMKYVQNLVLLHLRPIALSQDEVSDSAIRRLLYDAGEDIDDLMILCEADITSKNEALIKKYLKNFQLVRQKLKDIEEKDSIRNFQPPITGHDIINVFNLSPCPEIGVIKNAIKEAILDGKIENNYEEAYKFMIEKGKEIGLSPENNNKGN